MIARWVGLAFPRNVGMWVRRSNVVWQRNRHIVIVDSREHPGRRTCGAGVSDGRAGFAVSSGISATACGGGLRWPAA
jgi:hypothetical protein